MSLRRACRVIGLSTATWRYQRRTSTTNVTVLARLQAHAAVRARFGYRRLHILLKARAWRSITNACIGSTRPPAYDLGYFDDETCRLEPIEDPFGPRLSPMSPE